MLSIGEFSRVTRLSIKALRLYHEKGLLVPDRVSLESKYRYYSSAAVDKARIIVSLRDMGFSLDEIGAILAESRTDREIAAAAQAKLVEVERNLGRVRDMKANLELFLRRVEEKEAPIDRASDVSVEDLPEILVCGIRFKGRYGDVGPYFGRLYKACGRAARGKPYNLYYDGEYKSEDADIEVAVEVKAPVEAEGVGCHSLPGGRAVTLVHKGRYENLGRSYQKVFEYIRDKGLESLLPSREQYLRGPGMIFRGNPRRYLTRIVVPVKEKAGRG